MQYTALQYAILGILCTSLVLNLLVEYSYYRTSMKSTNLLLFGHQSLTSYSLGHYVASLGKHLKLFFM